MTLILGTYSDSEKLENENKSFHLYHHSLSDIDDDDIFDLVTTGKWIPPFREVVEKNLLDFIYNIIPKYITCFANAKINGILKIGIDDNSEISGIPYMGEIPTEKILLSIEKALSKNVCYSDSYRNCEDILKYINVETIPLETDINILNDDAEIFYKKLSNEIVNYNDRMDKYLHDHALFLAKHRQYSQKLELMLNKTKYRNELIKYIKSQNNSAVHLIKQLESRDFIKLKRTNIYEDRDNTNDFFYWIANFRDQMNYKICKNKPIKPLQPSIYHFRQIVSNLPAMRHKFITSNPDIKYYIIKITFNVGKLNKSLMFRDRYSNKWQYRRRVEYEENYGPGCI